MTTSTPAELDAIIARNLDISCSTSTAPICDIFAGLPASTVADQLRKLITSQRNDLPKHIARTADCRSAPLRTHLLPN